VTVSFNAFDPNDAALSFALPLFLLLILVAVLGVVAGGCAVWLGQWRWRRAARQHEADARSARAELAALRDAARPNSPPAPARLPVPSAGAGLYAPIVRDKQRATL
jgi:hypothetical protein